MPVHTTLPFQEDYYGCLNSLRSTLTELLVAAGVLHARPQEVAREFHLNKNLAWKISKLVHESPGPETLSFIPGHSGFRIFLQALTDHGLAAESLAKAEVAFDTFQAMVKRHAGDRPTLQLLLDSLAVQDGDATGLEESRRLAFQGNSGILGIQASVRYTTFFCAPNAQQPELLDTAFLGGLLGIRRFRPNACWPLSRHTGFTDDGTENHPPARTALDPNFVGPGPSIIGQFSSQPIPEVAVRQIQGMEIFELAEGPIGNRGIDDLCTGHYSRADLPRYRDAHNENGEFHIYLASPVAKIQYDLVLHKDLGVTELASSVMALNFHQAFAPLQARQPQDYLPMPEQARLLHGARPAFGTPLIPRYEEMTDYVFERMDWQAEDFRAWRLEIPYPPLPATLIMGFPLQEAPTSAQQA